MSNATHTPGRLKADGIDMLTEDIDTRRLRGRAHKEVLIARAGVSWMSSETSYANARRLCAAWNALAAFTTEQIEAGAVDLARLPDLLAALGWEGGTIHDALNCVRRLVAGAKERANADE